MRNFKRNSWTRMFVFFSIFSFLTFLNYTNAYAQTAVDREIAAPTDLGGEEGALRESQYSPGDELAAEELLRKDTAAPGAELTAPAADIQGRDLFSAPAAGEEPSFEQIAAPAPEIPKELSSPEIEVTSAEKEAPAVEAAPAALEEAAAPAEVTTPVEEAVTPEFVITDPEQQKALQEGMAELLLEASAGDAAILQEELTKAISRGVIVLAPSGAEAGAVDILADQAVANVASTIAKSTEAQNAVLNNLAKIKQTLAQAAPVTLGTGTTPSGTPVVNKEALKSIDTMQKAITSGDPEAIMKAMRSVEATFRNFGGPEMGMAFGGPRGDFGPGGSMGPRGDFFGPSGGGPGPMGFEGPGGEFDFFGKAFEGAGFSDDVMKSFTFEGHGPVNFDRAYGESMAGDFMAGVAGEIMSRMSVSDPRPPEAIFADLAGRGFDIGTIAKAVENIQADFIKQMGGGPGGPMGPMGPESGFRGGPGGDVFSSKPQDFMGPGVDFRTMGFSAQETAGMLHGGDFRFGPGESIGGLSQGYQGGGDYARVFETGGIVRDFFPEARQELEFFRLDQLDAKNLVPSTTLSPFQALTNLATSLGTMGVPRAEIRNIALQSYPSDLVDLVASQTGLFPTSVELQITQQQQQQQQQQVTLTDAQKSAIHTYYDNLRYTQGQTAQQAGQNTGAYANQTYGTDIGGLLATWLSTYAPSSEHLNQHPQQQQQPQSFSLGTLQQYIVPGGVVHVPTSATLRHNITYSKNMPNVANFITAVQAGQVPTANPELVAQTDTTVTIKVFGPLNGADVLNGNPIQHGEHVASVAEMNAAKAEQMYNRSRWSGPAVGTAFQNYLTATYPTGPELRGNIGQNIAAAMPAAGSPEYIALLKAGANRLREEIEENRAPKCHSNELHLRATEVGADPDLVADHDAITALGDDPSCPGGHQ